MEEQIKRVTRNLKVGYILFWIIPALLVVAGEMEWLPVGLLAEDVKGAYYFETVGILLTAVCVPLSLKLFSLILTKKINRLTITVALQRYFAWSSLRLMLLETAVIVNLFCYYFTLDTTGSLCALIALTASLFCLPGEKRLRSELHITKEEGIEP